MNWTLLGHMGLGGHTREQGIKRFQQNKKHFVCLVIKEPKLVVAVTIVPVSQLLPGQNL